MAPRSTHATDEKNFRLPMQEGYCREFEAQDLGSMTRLYPASLNDHTNRLTENLKVSPEGPVLDVFQIESETTVE